MNHLLNENLYISIRQVIEESRKSIVRHVNTTMVATYFHIEKQL